MQALEPEGAGECVLESVCMGVRVRVCARLRERVRVCEWDAELRRPRERTREKRM